MNNDLKKMITTEPDISDMQDQSDEGLKDKTKNNSTIYP